VTFGQAIRGIRYSSSETAAFSCGSAEAEQSARTGSCSAALSSSEFQPKAKFCSLPQKAAHQINMLKHLLILKETYKQILHLDLCAVVMCA